MIDSAQLAYLTDNSMINNLIIVAQIFTAAYYFVFFHQKARAVKASVVLDLIYLSMFLSVIWGIMSSALYLVFDRLLGIVGLLGIAVMVLKMQILTNIIEKIGIYEQQNKVSTGQQNDTFSPNSKGLENRRGTIKYCSNGKIV